MQAELSLIQFFGHPK